MSKNNYGWEIRYTGDFGRSLYGRYNDYDKAKAELAAFARRCRENGVKFTGEIFKV